jgi:hypothetical protein
LTRGHVARRSSGAPGPPGRARFAPFVVGWVAVGWTLAGPAPWPLVPDALEAQVAGSPPGGEDPQRAFALTPSRGIEGTGAVTLRQVWSPFGVSVGPDGHVEQHLVLTTDGLRPLGPDSAYVAWLATPDLSRVEPLGALGAAGTLEKRVVDWNKLLVIVTAEPSRQSGGQRWVGAIVLNGRTRSALLAPLWGHSIFRRIRG